MSNDREPTYVCDCGEEYMSEETLLQHQQTKCKNRSISCSFCQIILPTSSALREHLLLCGNKTDECPKCRRLIRRSHFAYHFENNCASIDKVETPPNQRRSRSLQRLPVNSNRPVLRIDIPNDDNENYPRANQRNSPVIITCEYCHQQCVQNDYKAHKENCLRSPINSNYKPSPRIPPRQNQNQNGAKGVVHIPCEICNEPVDLPNWSNHTQNCRERDMKRIKNHARSMSQEPIIDRLPCEYCQKLFPPNQLYSHEANCQNNPVNRQTAEKLARKKSPPSIVLPIKRKPNENNPVPSNFRPPKNQDPVQYEKIDIDQTHAANRSRSIDRSKNHARVHEQPVRLAASEEYLSQPNNSFPNDHAYENTALIPNGSRSNENILQKNFSNARRPERSSFKNLRNIEDNQNPRNEIPVRNDPREYDRKHQHRLQGHKTTYEVINNHPDRPIKKKNKKPSAFRAFFGCTNAVYD
ncbi:unnamed protein product [Adineta steineri]|uniref:Uncharacterized protein n=1 Tax=Adineta steineri TaxID=433720 RepID=A0A818MQG0_9BILA|nr:unnamed protein product [Adineta steineri]CAF3592886.1 unnamed protein product [Adineta steineri]